MRVQDFGFRLQPSQIQSSFIEDPWHDSSSAFYFRDCVGALRLGFGSISNPKEYLVLDIFWLLSSWNLWVDGSEKLLPMLQSLVVIAQTVCHKAVRSRVACRVSQTVATVANVGTLYYAYHNEPAQNHVVV